MTPRSSADSAGAIPDQHGRTFVVTGANSGLGLCTAKALAGAGATVLLACRNPDRAAVALDRVSAVATGAAPRTVALDLADLDQVAEAAAEITGQVERLDVLVNNAGVMAVTRSMTAQGNEMQFGVNHLGHFALTGHLLPTLLAAPTPRVISVSSGAHRVGWIHWEDLGAERHYNRWTRYGQSKLANLLFTSELARLSGEHRTTLIAAAAHPGYAATNLTTYGLTNNGARPIMRVFVHIADRLFAQSETAGALPQTHAATAPDVHGNDYFGPDGFLEQRGRGVQRVSRTARAADSDDARCLWEISEEMTGVGYPWPAAD